MNSSLEPVISEEDAQLENHVPIVQLVDFDSVVPPKESKHFVNHLPFQTKANKLKQIDNHNMFVQRIKTNCSKLEDPTLNFDLELHENDINFYPSQQQA